VLDEPAKAQALQFIAHPARGDGVDGELKEWREPKPEVEVSEVGGVKVEAVRAALCTDDEGVLELLEGRLARRGVEVLSSKTYGRCSPAASLSSTLTPRSGGRRLDRSVNLRSA
jgi:hypothetical protein